MAEERRLYVGRLNYRTGEPSLREAFSKYGAISDCAVVMDREAGRSRGFGFVTFENPDDAKEAEKGLNGTELDGRAIIVQPVTPKDMDSGGGRRGGGYDGRGGGGYDGGRGRYDGGRGGGGYDGGRGRYDGGRGGGRYDGGGYSGQD